MVFFWILFFLVLSPYQTPHREFRTKIAKGGKELSFYTKEYTKDQKGKKKTKTHTLTKGTNSNSRGLN